MAVDPLFGSEASVRKVTIDSDTRLGLTSRAFKVSYGSLTTASTHSVIRLVWVPGHTGIAGKTGKKRHPSATFIRK